MKVHNNFILIFLLASVLLLIVVSCSYLGKLHTLSKCEFRVTTLDQPVIANIDIQNIKSFADLKMLETGQITRSILKGKLPLSFILNVEVRNPNSRSAALNKLEYIAFIDDIQIATGSVEKYIEIESDGGISTIPIKVVTDIMEVLKKDAIEALFNFSLNLADTGNRPTRVSLKIKPYITVGGKDLVYPGYIKVKREFSSD